MNKIMSLLFIVFSLVATAQTTIENPKIIYGICTKDSLMVEPFSKWFTSNYDNYQPAIETINSLKKLSLENISIQLFFGSWCGDSKREVPRFLKLLSLISFPPIKFS